MDRLPIQWIGICSTQPIPAPSSSDSSMTEDPIPTGFQAPRMNALLLSSDHDDGETKCVLALKTTHHTSTISARAVFRTSRRFTTSIGKIVWTHWNTSSAAPILPSTPFIRLKDYHGCFTTQLVVRLSLDFGKKPEKQGTSPGPADIWHSLFSG